MTELIFWVTLSIFTTVYFFYWFYAAYKGAPYYPSSKDAIKQIVEEVKTISPKHIVELGSGDGRVAIALAKAGFKVTAIEINPILTLLTKLVARLRGLKIEVVTADMLKQDLSKYDLAIAYLYPGIMQKLFPKLEQELKPGALLLSNTFSVKNIEPIKKLDNKIYVYKLN